MTVSLVESNAPSSTTAINESSIRLTKPNSNNSVRQSLKKPIPNALALKGIIKNERNIMFYFTRACSTQALERLREALVDNTAHKRRGGEMTIFLNHIATHITKKFFLALSSTKIHIQNLRL